LCAAHIRVSLQIDEALAAIWCESTRLTNLLQKRRFLLSGEMARGLNKAVERER
jgi:hypothetical protein